MQLCSEHRRSQRSAQLSTVGWFDRWFAGEKLVRAAGQGEKDLVQSLLDQKAPVNSAVVVV